MTYAQDRVHREGGSLDFNGNGIAGCAVCGWRGVPTLSIIKRGPVRYPLGPRGPRQAQPTHGEAERSTYCPICTVDPEQEALMRLLRMRIVKVGRNAPCPCGSGKKFKRCHGA